MSGTALRVPVPPEQREKLVLILYPRRTGYLFHYVFGAVLILVGFTYNVLAAAGFVPYNETTWLLGLGSIGVGAAIMAAVEIRRRFTLYIVTTWNVRIRTGIFRRRTVRVFYDDIEQMETTASPEEQVVGMGDLEVYSRKIPDRPALVFRNMRNPEGIKEMIQRFVDTTPTPPPWSHIDY
ncbi:MAG: hypothetical protein DRO93_11490 [Candidatus Thorarchaeota archaeon]|nr:MAG: hypothetical protein DRO93_11490 [Candidatus Thorarchaeota archaeon]